MSWTNMSAVNTTSAAVTEMVTEDPSRLWYLNSIRIIRYCFLPIIVVGTVTNILNILTFSRRSLRSLSTSVYLLMLSFADFGLMYFQLFRIWFESAKLVDPRTYFSDPYCRAGNYLDVSFRDYSNWLVAAITIERLVVVRLPFKAKMYCTRRIAAGISLGLLLFTFGVRTHFLVWTRAQQASGAWVCWQILPSELARKVLLVIEAVCSWSVVFAVFAMNIALVIMLKGQKRVQSSKDDRDEQTRKLTRMMLGIGVLFMVCETPRTLMPIYHKFAPKTTTTRLINSVTYVLTGIDHACNFFIYVLSGDRFREEFFRMISCLRRRPTTGFSNDSSSSSVATQASCVTGEKNHA